MVFSTNPVEILIFVLLQQPLSRSEQSVSSIIQKHIRNPDASSLAKQTVLLMPFGCLYPPKRSGKFETFTSGASNLHSKNDDLFHEPGLKSWFFGGGGGCQTFFPLSYEKNQPVHVIRIQCQRAPCGGIFFSSNQRTRPAWVRNISVPWSRLSRFFGDGRPPTFNRNPYNGYKNPYYWVDDHPLLYIYGNNGSLDPGTHLNRGIFFNKIS